MCSILTVAEMIGFSVWLRLEKCWINLSVRIDY